MDKAMPTIREPLKLQHILAAMVWNRWLLLGLGCMQFILALVSPTQATLVSSAVTFIFALIATCIIIMVGRFELRMAIWISLGLMLIGTLLVVVFSPASPFLLILYPVLIAAGIAPYLPRATLRRVSFAGLALLTLLLAPFMLWPFGLNEAWVVPAQQYLAVLATVAIALSLIGQSNDMLFESIHELHRVNAELQAARTQLEVQVAERTHELAESVALLRTTLEATADGILVADAQQNPIIWNQKWLDLWDLPAEIVEARDIPAIMERVLPQLRDPEAFVQRAREAITMFGASSLDVIELVDNRVIERYSQPQHITRPTTTRVWSFRDITERVNAERRFAILASLGQRLNATTTVAQAGRIIVDVADALLQWDASFLNLYNAASDTMETVLDIDIIDGQRVETPTEGRIVTVSPMSRRTMVEGPQLVLREIGPEPVPLRTFGNTARASESMMFVPIRHGANVIGALSIQSYASHAYDNNDLYTLQGLADHCGGALERIRTEAALRDAEEQRQQLERKMLESQKLESLGVLAGGIAHDFNNLLAVIVGHIGLIEMDTPPASPTSESVQQIGVAARRAAELTHQMLAYTGKSQLHMQQIDVNELVAEMGDLLTASLPKHIRYQYALMPHLPAVVGDATQLRQVVMNLLVNAAEAVGDSLGMVSVRTEFIFVDEMLLATAMPGSVAQPGMYICLTVEDTGCGMEETTLAKIFEPFFSTKFTGRGLGLAAAQGIVRSHHGAIRVVSVPGQGTTFQVLLPPQNQPASTTDSSVGEPAELLPTGRGCVLVVDDEPSVRSMVARMLESFGYTPILAADGAAGVAAFRQRATTLVAVLLDLTMPEMHGHQALREMRGIDQTVPIVVMSGYTEQDALRSIDPHAMAGFLHKPFRIEQLYKALQSNRTIL